MPFNRSKVRPTVPNDLKEVIFKCLEVNESKRISIQDLKNLPYFQRVYQERDNPETQKAEVRERINSNKAS